MSTYLRAGRLAILFWAFMLGSLATPSTAEWLIFPSFETAYADGFDSDAFQDALIPGIDVFFVANPGSWRILVEALVSSEEQEFERFQIGRALTPDLTLWLGRHHSPIAAWNLDYHHGEYLQTSLTRPGFIDFEDDGGPVPSHVSGLLVEGQSPVRDGLLEYTVSLGAGPVLEEEGLEAFNILEPDLVGELSLMARVAYRWDPARLNQVAAFIGRLEIPAEEQLFAEVEQELWGLSWTRRSGRIAWMAEVLGARSALSNGFGTSKMIGAFVQVEIPLRDKLKLYSRVEEIEVEGADAAADDPYLSLFPALVENRALAGLRLEVARRQAVKVEVARSREVGSPRRTVVQAQWSLLFSSREWKTRRAAVD